VEPVKGGGGYSLVELLVSLALTALVFAMVFPFLQLQKEQWERLEREREEFRTLTSALGWLTSDIQEAGYHTGSPPILSIEEGKIVYALSRGSASSDAFSEESRRRVTVSLKGTDLMYRVQAWDRDASDWRRGSTQVLASGISSATFQGIDGRGETAGDGSGVRALRISLSGRGAGTLRTVVALRNRGGSR
jgi:type II secretory pathway component PulJ